MKNGTFGKENDVPIQKIDEKNVSNGTYVDLEDDNDERININKSEKEQKLKNQKNKVKKKSYSINSDDDSDNSSNNDNDNDEIKNDKKENNKDNESQNSLKEKEKILINSIQNKENATKQKIQLAEEINFNSIPDKLIATDEYGFVIEKNSETKPETKTKEELLQINARMEKWNYMIENYEEFSTSKFSKLKSRTRKGIPDSLRSYVWQLFAEKDKYYKKDIFNQLESVKLEEEIETVIIKDLDRTYPNCQLFRDKYGNGQRKLYKVLSNYSKYNTATGYVQGMGFIVAVFLTYMDEESSFFMLHSLMKKYKLEGFYLPSFPELKKTFYILLNLEKKYIPKIYEIFKKEGMIPSMYASEWFICLFSRNLSFDALVRIFDVFLLEGYKVIYRFALAFLKLKEDEFLKAKDGLVSIMKTCNECLEHVDVENLFKVAFGFSLSRKQIEKFGNEYDKVKSDQKNEFVKQL